MTKKLSAAARTLPLFVACHTNSDEYRVTYLVFYQVITGKRKRFETLSKEDALAFATKIYNAEGIIPEVLELDR